MKTGIAIRPRSGEYLSGDSIIVLERSGTLLCGVIDGLGHGPEAAAAASAAVACISSNAHAPLLLIMRECDRGIAHTRGAAIALIRLEAGELEHVAIGNVETLALSREPIHPVTRAGVVGARFRKAATARYRVHPGDLVALHTDGISRRMRLEPYRGLPPQTIAQAIVRDFGQNHDDASCLIVEV